MALVLKLFGDGRALVVFTILVHGLHASLLPSLSRLLFKRSAPGVFAGILCTALPVFAVLAVWDAMYSAVGLILFCLITSRLTMDTEHDLRSGVLAGLLGALLLLTNPATLVVLLCWVVFLAATRLRDRQRVARFCAGFVVILAVGCLPWMIRNYRELHAVVFIKDNLGLALYTSNNDCAQSSLEKNSLSGCSSRTSPFNHTEAALIARLGEAEYNGVRRSDALSWMCAHPRRFAGLTADRVIDFWFPPHSPAVWLITLLSITGLCVQAIRRDSAMAFLAAVLVTFPGIYYAIESNIRYRYPIMWVSLLSAGYALTCLAELVRHWRAVSERNLRVDGLRAR